jgi:signal transduction histidine kinase
MGRLVEDLLFLSRAEVGAIRFEMQPVVLQDVLEVALSEARVLAVSSEILLHATLPPEPCRVEGDVERLTQAFLIVLDNAIKYSDPGNSTELLLDDDGAEATVRVRSFGPTIPASDLPFVFNRFYRGAQVGARNATGSGLGLSIAKWIVDTHGGSVSLTSVARETVVTFRFPTYAARP